MSIVTASFLLMIASVGLMMSNSDQCMLIGSVLAGSAFGSLFQVLRALLTKTEMEVPRQILIYRFLVHSAGGLIFGVLGCLILLYWFKVELPLVLMGVAVGGTTGWMSERIAKRLEPRLLDILESTGRLPPKPLSKDAPTIDLTAPKRSEAPTTKLI